MDKGAVFWFCIMQYHALTIVSPASPTPQTSVPSASAAEPSPTSNPDMQKQQLSLQQQALRLLHVQAARVNANGLPSVNVDSKTNNHAIMQNIMAAARNGQLDMSNPAFQQFKNIVMLQQQQKAGQFAKGDMGNSAGMATGTANGDNSTNNGPGSISMPNMPNMEQMMQQAVKTQHAVQQQPGYGQGHNGTGMGNGTVRSQAAPQQPPQHPLEKQQQQQSQAQIPPNPRQTSGTDQSIAPPKIWTGDLTWPAGGGCKWRQSSSVLC